MTSSKPITIFNATKQQVPRVPYQSIYKALIKKPITLNIIFITNTYSQQLNTTYRKKDKPANMLTFSFNEIPTTKRKKIHTVGEIFINLSLARKEAKNEKISLKKHVGFLIIHGILHIRGYEHGKKMEEIESYYTTRLL